jgi:hypothetical protein
LAKKIDPRPYERRAEVHGLNNDLSVIIGQCDMLEGALTQQSDAAARVQLIKTTAQHMADKLATRAWPSKPATVKPDGQP